MRLLSEYWDSKWGKPSCFNLIGIYAFWEANPKTEDVLWKTWEKFCLSIRLFVYPLSHEGQKACDACPREAEGSLCIDQRTDHFGSEQPNSGTSKITFLFEFWSK